MKSTKHVLIVAASPRKNSNSTTLAIRAAEGVKDAGGEAEVVLIGNLKIAPCNACDSCRTGSDRGCVINDDMQSLYQKIRDAQSVIFATPVYWFSVSAQMKLFIDRTYGMSSGGVYGFTGKDVGVILTYEDEDVFISGGVNALRSFQDTFAYVRANLVGMVYGTVGKPGSVKSDIELMQRSYELGKKITQAK
jgi:multimeric flavodoxin WrbA